MLKKDKQKVLDEVWTEDRIKSFLDIQPAEDVDADFHALSTAYKSMRLDDFQIFLGFFKSANRNLDATNPAGETLLSIVRQHRKGDVYGEALIAAGASAA